MWDPSGPFAQPNKKSLVKFINVESGSEIPDISNAQAFAERATIKKECFNTQFCISGEALRIGISKHRQMIDKCLYFPMCRRVVLYWLALKIEYRLLNQSIMLTKSQELMLLIGKCFYRESIKHYWMCCLVHSGSISRCFEAVYHAEYLLPQFQSAVWGEWNRFVV